MRLTPSPSPRQNLVNASGPPSRRISTLAAALSLVTWIASASAATVSAPLPRLASITGEWNCRSARPKASGSSRSMRSASASCRAMAASESLNVEQWQKRSSLRRLMLRPLPVSSTNAPSRPPAWRSSACRPATGPATVPRKPPKAGAHSVAPAPSVKPRRPIMPRLLRAAAQRRRMPRRAPPAAHAGDHHHARGSSLSSRRVASSSSLDRGWLGCDLVGVPTIDHFSDEPIQKSEASLDRAQLPLNALRAFEASARHLSFTRAGLELCVGQAAVSHQVNRLEALLSVRLFHRLPRGLALTDEGAALVPMLVDSFDRMAAMLD